MTAPTHGDRDLMAAYLLGYVEEGALTSITLDKARQVLAPTLPPGTTIDGMAVSHALRRLGFRRSYLPADTGTITYRKVE